VEEIKREIKFRYYSDGCEAMIYGKEALGILNSTVQNNVTVDNLMQYTGLKSKSGVEIYEGDFLLWDGRDRDEKEHDLYTVRWDVTGFVVDARLSSGTVLKNESIIGDWEVIGNIYENPELLEGEKDERN